MFDVLLFFLFAEQWAVNCRKQADSSSNACDQRGWTQDVNRRGGHGANRSRVYAAAELPVPRPCVNNAFSEFKIPMYVGVYCKHSKCHSQTEPAAPEKRSVRGCWLGAQIVDVSTRQLLTVEWITASPKHPPTRFTLKAPEIFRYSWQIFPLCYISVPYLSRKLWTWLAKWGLRVWSIPHWTRGRCSTALEAKWDMAWAYCWIGFTNSNKNEILKHMSRSIH